MTAVPIYVWNGTAWQETGPTIPANPIKYQASAPSSPSTGDIWVDSDGDVTTGSQQFQRFRFVASGGETTISGADANGAVLAYTAGLEQVVLNGAVLVRGHDYTATNGTSITGLSPALVANDVLEVFSFIAFTVANTYTQSQVDGLLTSYQTKATNGLVLLNTTSFSAATSASFPNGTFSATYKNYRILVNCVINSGSGTLYARLRVGGADNTSSVYQIQRLQSQSTTTSSYNSGDTNLWDDFGQLATVVRPISADLFQPFETTPTTFSSIHISATTGANLRVMTGNHSNSTSFDSLSIIPSTGTITGTMSAYGYVN
jgi:hypothetical protein